MILFICLPGQGQPFCKLFGPCGNFRNRPLNCFGPCGNFRNRLICHFVSCYYERNRPGGWFGGVFPLRGRSFKWDINIFRTDYIYIGIGNAEIFIFLCAFC